MHAGEGTRQAIRAATLSLVATAVVVTVKLIGAWQSNAVSVWAEALQSSIDILVTALMLWSIRIAARPPDREHPYGHGKAEVLIAAVQGLLILTTAGWIVIKAYGRLLSPAEIAWGWGAGAMAYSAVSNVAMGAYLGRVARATDSEAIKSEVLHLRSDTLASLGVLGGMALVGLTGQAWLDPVFGTILMLAVIVQAFFHLRETTHSLMEGALPPEENARLEDVLLTHPEVRGYHELRTRRVGSLRVVEVHVMLDDALTFVAAHDLAEQIESELSRCLGGARVVIHYEPYEAEMAHREREHR